jgi:hypothetical protein
MWNRRNSRPCSGHIGIDRMASKARISAPRAAPYQRQPGCGEPSVARARETIQKSKIAPKMAATVAFA